MLLLEIVQILTMTDIRFLNFVAENQVWQMIDYSFFPVTCKKTSMTDDSFFCFYPQTQNMIDDSITVTTTKLLKTYHDRWQISAYFVSFLRIPSMTDDSFFTFVTQNPCMTDDRLQLFLGLPPPFWPWQITAFFFCHVCDFWPWQMTGFQPYCANSNHDR